VKTYRIVSAAIGAVLGVTFALGTVWGHAGHGVEARHIAQDALLSLLVVFLFTRGIAVAVLDETFAGFKKAHHNHERKA